MAAAPVRNCATFNCDAETTQMPWRAPAKRNPSSPEGQPQFPSTPALCTLTGHFLWKTENQLEIFCVKKYRIGTYLRYVGNYIVLFYNTHPVILIYVHTNSSRIPRYILLELTPNI